MERQTEILVICTNAPILATVLRLLNTNENWNATGVASPEEALKMSREVQYEVFLIGAGLTDAEEEQVAAQVKEMHPDIHIIPHYGGGSGLLFAEIYLALGSK